MWTADYQLLQCNRGGNPSYTQTTSYLTMHTS